MLGIRCVRCGVFELVSSPPKGANRKWWINHQLSRRGWKLSPSREYLCVKAREDVPALAAEVERLHDLVRRLFETGACKHLGSGEIPARCDLYTTDDCPWCEASELLDEAEG